MKLKTFLVLLILCLSFACNQKASIPPEMGFKLDHFAQKLMDKDIIDITTQKGFQSIIDWSDSLRDDRFLYSLSDDLEEKNIFLIEDWDSLICLSLGKPDKIVGATGGYLILRKYGTELKIDEFVGGE